MSLLFSCSKKSKQKEQSIPLSGIDTSSSFDTSKGLRNSYSFTQISITPNSIILTGINNVRLFSIYKIKNGQDKNISYSEGTSYYDEEERENEDANFKYFMAGIDIIHGYNLVNIGHYSLDKDSLSYFFDRPVLIKTLYFPGVRKDSLNKQPVTRNFFLVSVYNEDTNNDSLISNKDLRRFFFIDEFNKIKISLLPNDYSAIRSSYDYKNDIMFIHARLDKNKNGALEPDEPVSIFWLKLDNPKILKKIM
jgi:hypothetical protein